MKEVLNTIQLQWGTQYNSDGKPNWWGGEQVTRYLIELKSGQPKTIIQRWSQQRGFELANLAPCTLTAETRISNFRNIAYCVHLKYHLKTSKSDHVNQRRLRV